MARKRNGVRMLKRVSWRRSDELMVMLASSTREDLLVGSREIGEGGLRLPEPLPRSSKKSFIERERCEKDCEARRPRGPSQSEVDFAVP
jgi:hypothetical protein